MEFALQTVSLPRGVENMALKTFRKIPTRPVAGRRLLPHPADRTSMWQPSTRLWGFREDPVALENSRIVNAFHDNWLFLFCYQIGLKLF